MSLAIVPPSASIQVNTTQQFTASGGTAPYVFTLVSGVGSITSGGLYTAPNSPGTAVIRVTDDDAATTTASIVINNHLTLFCDIIKTWMDLDDDQVYLWDQKYTVPSDSRLYIAVGILSCKPFSNNREMIGSVGGLTELMSTNFHATLSVDIMSRGTDARDRKEEVIMALGSNYAEQIQEANGFKVALIPSGFVNLSQIDGSAIPYRFNISVAIQYQVSKSRAVDYYDTFETDPILVDP